MVVRLIVHTILRTFISMASFDVSSYFSRLRTQALELCREVYGHHELRVRTRIKRLYEVGAVGADKRYRVDLRTRTCVKAVTD